MRRTLSVAAAAVLTVTLLSACAPGENEEAAAAAEQYSARLLTWADDVSTAAVQRVETDTDVLSEALDDAPELAAIDGAENTASYTAAEQTSAHVSLIVTELRGYATSAKMEPISDEIDAASRLTERIDRAFTTRFDAASDAVIHGGEESVRGRLGAYGAYAKSMIAAFQEEAELVRTLVPDTDVGLSASLRGFILDRLDRRIAFQERTVSNTASWSQFADGYDDFFDEDPDTSWTLLAVYMSDDVVTGYTEQLADVATALAGAISGDTADTTLPAIGDPYRTVLIDGILPSDAPSADKETMWRLWLLCRIRELESTPDAAYDEAVAAISEEFIVHVETDVPTAKDYRAGSSRVLNAVAAHSRVAADMNELDDDWLTALDEVRAYQDSLRQMPMVAALSAAFDDLLVRQDTLHEQIRTLVDDGGADARDDVTGLVEGYLHDADDVLLPAVREIDQPESFEKLRADAIEATAPDAD